MTLSYDADGVLTKAGGDAENATIWPEDMCPDCSMPGGPACFHDWDDCTYPSCVPFGNSANILMLNLVSLFTFNYIL